jgi:hypothetical protein
MKTEQLANKVFKTMLKASDKLGLPKRFASDMHHDQKLLYTKGVPEAFGWILYESGTHFVHADKGRKLKGWEDLFNIFKNLDGVTWFLGNRNGVKQVALKAFAQAMTGQDDSF